MLRSARNQIECAFGRRKARCAILTRKCYIDEELVKVQSKFDKQNERNHVNVLDQIYSSDGSEGFVVRRLLTDLI